MTETEAVPGLVQIGETLRAAREGRGVSLEQAATQLRCDQRVIEALEGGRFDDLGPPVFARGHLLRYAALLGEPGEAMVEEWSQIAAAGTSAELMRGLHGPRGRDLRQVRRRLVIAAALLCAVSIAVWALQNLPGRNRAAATSASTVAAAPAAARPVAPALAEPVVPQAAEVAAPVSVPSGAIATAASTSPPAVTPPAAASLPAPVSASASVSPPSSAPRAAKPSAAVAASSEAPAGEAAGAASRSQVRLRMAFAADSWLEIYDVRNRRLFFGLATVGAPVDVQGRAPLRVIVGNAPAATVELNGRRVEVPPGAMRGRRAAALRVNADGRLIALPRA